MNKYKKTQYIKQIKHKNGWSFQVRYKGIEKSFYEGKYGDSRIAYNEAIKYRNQLINDEVEYLKPFNITIYDVMLESFDLLLIRKKTRLNQISLFNRYIKDNISINNFDESFIYSKLNAMVEITTDEMIHRVFTLFKRIDKTCLIKKYYKYSIIPSIICPQSHLNTHRRIKEPITREELDKLISACKTIKKDYNRKLFPLILEFLYQTGVRPCEAWALTWDDISDDYISINKEVGSSTTELITIRPAKTQLSNRLIPINQTLKNLLEQAKNDSNLIFPDENGSLIDTDLIGRKFKKIANKIGIQFNLYDLRHRFATDLTLNKIDDRTKMELMGHSNISRTLDYARSNEKEKKNALKNR